MPDKGSSGLTMKSPWALHWFRRDLRITGNATLAAVTQEFKGRVLGVFCFDSKFLSRPDFSNKRFAFFLKTLESLQQEMKARGGDLLVLDRGYEEFFSNQLFVLEQPPALVSWNRDYEPYARDRDQKVESVLLAKSIAVRTERDHLLIEPSEIAKDDGKPYVVYSPFFRKFESLLQSSQVLSRIQHQERSLSKWQKQSIEPASGPTSSISSPNNPLEKYFSLRWSEVLLGGSKSTPASSSGTGLWADQLQSFLQTSESLVSITLPKAGFASAWNRLSEFVPGVNSYKDLRDFPGTPGTSKLSVYFKNGSLVSSQVVAQLQLHKKNSKRDLGAHTFLKEIAWREFYYHILWHFPRVEGEAFLTRYKNLNWENNESHFKAWCEGKTGYPIVDAGMRELKLTGWMHNRVRMIVASFLTKDLLVDWKWGERFFMEHLLDGDLAPNNGGWQWAASTGCDPQPYFRIFNPYLQSVKFDPQGHYIRQFVPELAKLSEDEIHHPPRPEALGYVKPIVDHQEQKAKALALYKFING